MRSISAPIKSGRNPVSLRMTSKKPVACAARAV
jgi:hypothetical protein